MSKLPTSYVKPILRSMYPHRREMVPCFIGDPGIGKTQGIYEFAEEIGVKVVTFILSNTVPSEVSGMRMPDKESKKMEVFDDMRMASLKDGDILFFDEILEAPPMLWSACLTLIQDRLMASGRKLPDVFIVAASNPVASPAIIPASVRNRFQFIELEFDADSWCKWFEDKYNVSPRELTTAIRGNSDQYNIITPREVTKLFEYISDGYDSVKKTVISQMFDGAIAQRLADMLGHHSLQRQIIMTLREADIVIPSSWVVTPIGQLYEMLQNLDDWDKIQKVLESTEFEVQDEDDVIPY